MGASECRPVGSPPDEARLTVSGDRLPGRCLLRVRERPPGPDRAWHELDARAAAASEHVVGIVGASAVRRVRGREVDAVLLEAPEHGDLEGLLARRGGIRSGEAATILLGVAAGVGALHSSGWAGPELTGPGIVFLGDGCPALDALDGVEPWTADGAVTDAERFYALGRTVCLRVVDGSGMRLLGAVGDGLRQGSWTALAEAVLRAVAPEPVAFADPGQSEAGRVDATGSDGAVGLTACGPPVPPRSARGAVAGRPGVRIALLASRAMDALDGRPGRALGRRIRAFARRRPVLVAVAAVPVVTAVALVALLPSSGTAPAPATAPATAPGERVPGERVEEPEVSHSGPVPATASVAASAAASAAPESDPVEAARAILAARHSCFAARPPRTDCLTAVLDDGSPLIAEETAALAEKGASGARDYRGAQLSLVERWGAAALISAAPDAARTPKSHPASLLLVRSEAGWRLRAVYP